MPQDPSDLQRQIADLDRRLRALEAARSDEFSVRAAAIPASPKNVLDTPRVSPPNFIPPWERKPAEPATAGRPVAQPASDFASGDSIETRIGARLFNRIGIAALLIGMAWFIQYSFDNGWIGPIGKVLIGLAAGTGFILWSERFRARGFTWFSYSLKAVGSGVLYLSLWAAYDMYDLVPAGVAFGAMMLVTAWNGFMCWAQDSELLAFYALIGGFLTPVLASTGENQLVALCLYMLLLDGAVFFLVIRRHWPRLLVAAFVATTLLFALWKVSSYTNEQFAITSVFVTAFFVLFACASWFAKPPDAESEHPQWYIFSILALPLLNAAVAFLTFYEMLESKGQEWIQGWMAVAFGAFYLGMLQVPAFKKDGEYISVLRTIHLTLVITFLTVAIPLNADGYWVAVGWLVEGAALMWGARMTKIALLRTYAAVALGLGGLTLIRFSYDTVNQIVFNPRFAAYLIGIASFLFVIWIARQALQEPGLPPQRLAPFLDDIGAFLSWTHLLVASVVIVNFLILVAVSAEIHSFWELRDLATSGFKRFSLYIWWMLFGAILVGIGFWKRTAFFRWQGIFLLIVSIAAVFTQMWTLSQAHRIISFLGLGALLLTVSYAYQRDWFGLRGTSPDERNESSSTHTDSPA